MNCINCPDLQLNVTKDVRKLVLDKDGNVDDQSAIEYGLSGHKTYCDKKRKNNYKAGRLQTLDKYSDASTDET